MNASELYTQAGKPSRAIVKLDGPTKVYTGLRRASVKTEFEAYITQTAGGNMAYYINPNARHAFYMPENVIEFIPIDTMELWFRARKAAEYIKAGKTHGRELDNAFENYDSDFMCAALYRMSRKSKKLQEGLNKAWGETGVLITFTIRAKTYAHLTDGQLSQAAAEHRAAEIAKWNTVFPAPVVQRREKRLT